MTFDYFCACGHDKHQHSRANLGCGAWGCACSGFISAAPDARRNRRSRRSDRASDEKNRRIQVLRSHILPLIEEMQRGNEAASGDWVPHQLTDRVVGFVLRSSATDYNGDGLARELAAVLSEPLLDVPGPLANPVLFPLAQAKDILDEIVEAAHHVKDPLFQEAS